MLRLLVCDSSISARIARRSSVAETTGKRRTSAAARANMPCKAENRRCPRAPLAPRQSQKAGIASSSQLRLSSSSISSYFSDWKPAETGNLYIVFQKCRIPVNVTSVFPVSCCCFVNLGWTIHFVRKSARRICWIILITLLLHLYENLYRSRESVRCRSGETRHARTGFMTDRSQEV